MDLLNKGNDPIDSSEKSDEELVNETITDSFNSGNWIYLLHNSPIAAIYSEDERRYNKLESLILSCDLIESQDDASNGWKIRITPSGNLFLHEFGTYSNYTKAATVENKKKLDESKSKTELELEKLHLEVNKLRSEFLDYPKTKRRIRRNELFTIITILISLAALAVSIIYKK